jgi:c-di-GMP-binding flagellar brake protein YcgR
MTSRRQVHRTEPRNEDYLEVVIHKAGRAPFKGTLLDASYAGTAVVLEPPSAPVLVDGENVEVEFKVPGGASSLHVAASVMYSVERAGFRRYGFLFADREALDDGVPFLLREVFNRRAAPRVIIESEKPCAIVLEALDGSSSLRGELYDISAAGLSFRTPIRTGEGSPEGRPMRALFRLPKARQNLDLVGQVSDRRFMNVHWAMGFRFDTARSKQFEQQQALVLDYVADQLSKIDAIWL